jgi:hypothetical protein
MSAGDGYGGVALSSMKVVHQISPAAQAKTAADIASQAPRSGPPRSALVRQPRPAQTTTAS